MTFLIFESMEKVKARSTFLNFPFVTNLLIRRCTFWTYFVGAERAFFRHKSSDGYQITSDTPSSYIVSKQMGAEQLSKCCENSRLLTAEDLTRVGTEVI